MSPVVRTDYGPVRGVERDGCTEYLGIPFAAPPVGDRAFRRPAPPEPWNEALVADHPRSNPIQPRGGDHPAGQSQDCLYLNVFVPNIIVSGESAERAAGSVDAARSARPAKAIEPVETGISAKTVASTASDAFDGPRPVMVWIYGGSYSHGGSGMLNGDPTRLEYDMALFARETGAIVVTFNYRLNLYGFLNLHYLSERFDPNCGLFDQIAALRFVHDNIASFGGDPDNVTVFGQSAGAACILALMGMPEADGLFQRCIIQSACVEHFFSEEESERNTRRFLRMLGVRPDRLGDLLGIDPARVRRACRRYDALMLAGGEMRCAFSPTIDGITLRGDPKLAAMRSTLPMLIGNVGEEAERFVRGIPVALYPILTRLYGLHPKRAGDGDDGRNHPDDHVRDDVQDEHGVHGLRGYRRRVVDVASDHLYRRPLYEILDGYAGPAWKYEYRYQTPSGRAAGLGCFHASELPVLFGQPSRRLTVDDTESRRVGHEMRGIWGRFARTGDPGWARFSEDGAEYVIE